MKPPLKKKLSVPLASRVALTIVIFLCLAQIAKAQICAPLLPCPAGYTCVNYRCQKIATPSPPPCTCVRPVPARCAPMCTFLSEENNERSSVAISPGPLPGIITINFQLENAESISLGIYDTAGKLIRTVAAERIEQGSHEVEWDEKDEDGNTVSNGIYILQFDTPNKSETKKLAVTN